MTPRFIRLALAPLALPLIGAFAGCNGAVPRVSGHNLVIPDRSPTRQVQALSSPSTDDTESGSGNDAQAYCLDGQAGPSTNDPDGTFTSEWDCAPGGGIASISNAGFSDPNTGDGHYDQTTVFEDGTLNVWHFTFDTSDDFLSTTYTGVSDDGTESYVGTYTYSADHPNQSQMHEEWNLHEGTYVTDGLVSNDGTSFDGTETFDDPATDASPDWSLDEVTNPDGTFSQDVHFAGDGFVSDYTYAVDAAGAADYSFATDLTDTDANPDYDGAYHYAADGSGEGGYRQLFDDGSTDDVHDVINADGSVDESWSFDDVATEQSVDQEGSMHWNVDGSADGTVTNHIVDGGDQTCEVHIDADGSQTVDNCG